MKRLFTTLTLATFLLMAAGCDGDTGSADPEFEKNFQETIRAAEAGKDLVKKPGKKSR